MKHFIELNNDRIAIIQFAEQPQLHKVPTETKYRFDELYQALCQSERKVQNCMYIINQIPSDWMQNPEWAEKHKDLQTEIDQENKIIETTRAEYDKAGSTLVPVEFVLHHVTFSPMFGRYEPQADIRCIVSGNEWDLIADAIQDLTNKTAGKTITLQDANDQLPY